MRHLFASGVLLGGLFAVITAAGCKPLAKVDAEITPKVQAPVGFGNSASNTEVVAGRDSNVGIQQDALIEMMKLNMYLIMGLFAMETVIIGLTLYTARCRYREVRSGLANPCCSE